MKNLQFWCNHADFLVIWPTHVYYLLTKFHDNWTKIVEFLLMETFFMCLIFFGSLIGLTTCSIVHYVNQNQKIWNLESQIYGLVDISVPWINGMVVPEACFRINQSISTKLTSNQDLTFWNHRFVLLMDKVWIHLITKKLKMSFEIFGFFEVFFAIIMTSAHEFVFSWIFIHVFVD